MTNLIIIAHAACDAMMPRSGYRSPVCRFPVHATNAYRDVHYCNVNWISPQLGLGDIDFALPTHRFVDIPVETACFKRE